MSRAFYRSLMNQYIEPLLLDLITGKSVFDFFKIKSSYEGPCFEARRVNGDTQDIDYLKTTADKTAFLAWAGTDCWVRTAYDQEENANWVQTNNDRQFQIVESGELITLNGKPAMRANYSDSTYMTSDASNDFWSFLHNGNDGFLSMIAQAGVSSVPSNQRYAFLGNRTTSGETGFQLHFHYYNGSDRFRLYTYNGTAHNNSVNHMVENGFPQLEQNLVMARIDADNTPAANRCKTFLNNGGGIKQNTQTHTPSATPAPFPMHLGAQPGVEYYTDGYFQHLGFYESLVDHSVVETHLNKNYSIF